MEELRESISALDGAVQYLWSAIDDLMSARFLVQSEAEKAGKAEKGVEKSGKSED